MKNASLSGAVVVITGGTGTFGSAFLDRCLAEGAEEVRIFSRDEKKQYDMAQMYRDHDNVTFILGDVRDAKTLTPVMRGADFVFHAAAMKQVPSCECFPMEAVKTNIVGSDNVLMAALQQHVKKVVCLSTDKAVYPTSAMGMTKAYMEKLAMQRALEQRKTEICITRFGNLVASRGSAVPLFMEQIRNGLPITITEPEMTRFVMTVDEAIDLVSKAFSCGQNGDLLVKRGNSCTTGTLAKAVCRFMNIPDDYPVKIIGARAGEKMHESLLTDEEAQYAIPNGDYAIVRRGHKRDCDQIDSFRSDHAYLLNVDETVALLERVFGKEEHHGA